MKGRYQFLILILIITACYFIIPFEINIQTMSNHSPYCERIKFSPFTMDCYNECQYSLNCAPFSKGLPILLNDLILSIIQVYIFVVIPFTIGQFLAREYGRSNGRLLTLLDKYFDINRYKK